MQRVLAAVVRQYIAGKDHGGFGGRSRVPRPPARRRARPAPGEVIIGLASSFVVAAAISEKPPRSIAISLLASGSEIEQARIRSGRFDHPSVHAETIGTRASSAQPARRTSRRRRRLERRDLPSHGRSVAGRVGPRCPIDRVGLTAGTSIKTASERGSVRSDRFAGMSVSVRSAWLMAAPSRPRRRPVATRGSGFQSSATWWALE